jgi:hypothetical protein
MISLNRLIKESFQLKKQRGYFTTVTSIKHNNDIIKEKSKIRNHIQCIICI